MDNKTMKIILKETYGPICFAGGKLTSSNRLTLHHIQFKCLGGTDCLENAANVASLEHSGIHIASGDDIRKLKVIKCLLYEYKETRCEEIRSVLYDMIHTLMDEMGMEPTLTKDGVLIYMKRKGNRKR